MARAIKLNKTSIKKIETWLNELDLKGETDEQNMIKNQIMDIIIKDVKMIKDCSEKYIVDFYIESGNELCKKIHPNDEEFIPQMIDLARHKLVDKYVSNESFTNNIDIYFNEVKREYILHPQGESEELEFIPENRDIFIKNNLKLVIDCAKRYRNFGLPFEDLIQIGNCGLLKAWEKFDISRANLQNDIIKDIKTEPLNRFTSLEAKELIKRNFKYTKLLDVTLSKIPNEGFVTKDEFIDWVKVNIKKASFSSIGFAWIRAMIILELNSYSKIIRVPKSKLIDENTINIIRLDSINPHTNDNYNDNQISEIANEEFLIEDEAIENMERNNLFKDLVNELIGKLGGMERRIIKKRFGIDVPYQLSLSEIAESEGISAPKVKSIITSSLKIIAENIPAKDKELLIDMLS